MHKTMKTYLAQQLQGSSGNRNSIGEGMESCGKVESIGADLIFTGEARGGLKQSPVLLIQPPPTSSIVNLRSF